jgi:bifunctional non-homologous end joining protein LigD
LCEVTSRSDDGRGASSTGSTVSGGQRLRRPLANITYRDLMLATTGKLFSRARWIYELKYDGFRCLVSKGRGIVRLQSRSGRDLGPCFPKLVDEIMPIPHDFAADSELVVLDERGCPQWNRLTKRHAQRSPTAIKRAAAADPAAIFVFNLLWLNGADLRPRPLLERKAALLGVMPGNRRIRYARHMADSSLELWQMANELEPEGILAKDAQSIDVLPKTSGSFKLE